MPHGRTPLAPPERLRARGLAACWLYTRSCSAADHAHRDLAEHGNDLCVGDADTDPDGHLERDRRLWVAARTKSAKPGMA